ncbi:MAG: trehalose-6-phosphate synthase [SAR324 cluster bacterium]|nr:trehalose-6-phosphate synthase [SAR324 cluster bacterium]
MARELKLQTPSRRLVLISNRLPISLSRANGKWQITSSSGGLVTAMGPVLRNRGGMWIGWPGTVDSPGMGRLMDAQQEKFGFSLAPVMLTQEEQENFYFGFSNKIIWPLFHGLQSLCDYNPAYWTAYEVVNLKFAHSILENSSSDDYIWIHDYHLMSSAKYLRGLGMKSQIGFFLHIPFPPPDIFHKLPWRTQILEGLLEFDLLGFQTSRHKRNFMHAVRTMLPELRPVGKGQISRIPLGGREVRVGHFPIGIDYKSFSINAASPEVEHQVIGLHDAFPGCTKILGVDRLDYTKGLPYKLDGFRNALQNYPELRRKVTLIQVVVPSREDIPEYNALKAEIERLVGQINGQFADPGWLPIHYTFRSLKRDELLAYYRACEVALVTPLEDGMNLVAKEYCACSEPDGGVLILSEFAGAAAQLRGSAIIVNPYDLEGVAAAINEACMMDASSRSSRMRKLQRVIKDQDIFWWVDSFLQAGISSELEDYPMLLQARQGQVDDSWWWESV